MIAYGKGSQGSAQQKARKYRVRFHLAKGEHYMWWQVSHLTKTESDTKKRVYKFYDPADVQIVMHDCRLKNDEKTATKIYNKEQTKDVISWVECNKVEVLKELKYSDKSMPIIYNPHIAVNWHDADGNILDNFNFPILVTINKRIYYPAEDGKLYELGGVAEFEYGGSTEKKEKKMKDLFEDYTNIPPQVQEILDKYSDGIEDGNYSDLGDARNELEEIGYTFEYYLDGTAYGLRPIDVPINSLEGYEDFDMYTIYEGYDHLKSQPLYRVQASTENRDEYTGEWHSNKSDAENELADFKQKKLFKTGGYTRPAYDLKTTGVYLFKTNKGNFEVTSYLFERENDTEDSLEIQDELRNQIGSIIIKNSAWKQLASGKSVKARSSKGNYTGTITRMEDISPVKANVGLAILGASMLQQRQQQRAMQPPKRSRWEDRGLDYMRPQYVAPAPMPQPMPQPVQQAPMQTPYGNIDQQQLTNALMMSNAKFELGGMPKMNDPVMLGFTHYYTIRLDYEKAKEYADNLKSMHPTWDVIVTQEDNNYYILVRNPINMGSRVYADGGTLDGKRIQFKHWSGDVKHGIILGMSRDGKAYDVQYGNGHVLVRPNEIVNVYARGGYPTGRAWTREHYHDNDAEDYEVDPRKRKVGARNRKFMSGGFTPNGYVVLIFNNKPHHFSAEYINGQIEDIDLNSGDDAKDLESFINKEFNEWLESAPKEYESLYYGEYDEPAQLSKSGAIEDAYGFIYEDLVQKVKEGKKPIIDLDRDESNLSEAFYKKGGSIFKSFEDFGNWFLGSRKSYPTGRAWTREHYHDNDDEDYEVDPRKRKVRARNRKYMAGGNVEERYARKADDTGRGINEGYVVGDGEMYFAEKESLINWLRSRGGMEGLSDDFILNEAYNLDEYYYTEWDESEIEDQGYYYTADGEEIEMNARGGYPTGRAWTKEHYNDNEDEDYEIDPKSRHSKHRARNRFDVGGGVDDYKNHLASVDVIFANPKYNYSTSVSGSITEQEARDYFVGKTFNVGSYPTENLQRVIDIKFYPKGTYKTGGELIGNQHKIDMNKNGRIDAEDFEILRNSMNGAWRNEHKHVNHSEDWETKYARKNNSSRTGYKGRKEYGTGGLSGKGSRAKNRYNKEVEAYKWFVVSDNKDVDAGFEYKSDATDLAKELNEGEYKGAKWKVVSLVALKRQGIADPRENWKYKAGFGAFLLGAGMGAVLGNEVAKSGASATASKLKNKARGIKRKVTDDYADFKRASKKKS